MESSKYVVGWFILQKLSQNFDVCACPSKNLKALDIILVKSLDVVCVSKAVLSDLKLFC